MALRFLDSFDHYQTASYTDKYTDAGGFYPTIVPGVGRCGTQALYVTVFNQVAKGINFLSDTVYTGFNIKLDTALGADLNFFVLGGSWADHVMLVRTPDGVVHASSNGAILGSSLPDALQDQEWSYLEVKVKVHASAGTVDIRINGASVMALTGKNTKGAANTAVIPTRIGFYGNDNESYWIDDLYALDTVVETNNANITWLGPTHVERLLADGAGTYVTDFSLVGAATQWQAVRDAAGPDDDTSYISTSTAGHRHSSTFEGTGLPAGTIHGVQVLLHARVTDAGYRGITPLVVSGGVDHLGVEKYPSMAYRYHHHVFEVDPQTTLPWTIAGVNAAEFGVKITA